MGSSKSKKPKPVPVKDPETARRRRRIVMHTLAVVVFVGLLGVGYYHVQRYVRQDVTFPTRPPRVVLKNRPAWMSDARAMQIINSVRPAGTHSAFDRQLLADTAAILQANPWVKQVRQVRRAYGERPADTLEIDCEYRAPIALVHWKDYYWLVDGERVQLPEQFTEDQLPGITRGADRKLNIRIVEGVSRPPVESGQHWSGDDLTAALDMAKLLYGQAYADEIERIDVANFAGRIDPKEAQITLITRYGTQVRWGRPIDAKDFFVEVPTAQKLKYLQTIYAEYHRVDGGRAWIDIRFDRITYPSGDAAVHANGSR